LVMLLTNTNKHGICHSKAVPEHLLSATLYFYMQVLSDPALVLYNKPDSPVVTEAMLRGIWTCLRDCLN
jgi:hypothetical protein